MTRFDLRLVSGVLNTTFSFSHFVVADVVVVVDGDLVITRFRVREITSPPSASSPSAFRENTTRRVTARQLHKGLGIINNYKHNLPLPMLVV